MITQRIATSIRQQEWVTIFIEFILVIAGVLIALELDKWNESRAQNGREIEILISEVHELEQNISDMETFIGTLTQVFNFGAIAADSLTNDTCSDDCWPELVAFFHASQWLDVGLSREVYDQMRRIGLPRDTLLQEKLTAYYNVVKLSRTVSGNLPRYRELIRSLIPRNLQQHLWTECFKYENGDQVLIADCKAPPQADLIRRTIDKVKATPEVETSLNYWLSTVTVMTSTLQLAIEALNSYIERER